MYHVLPALHEFLIDDLASVVLAGLDMDCLLDYGACPASECLSSAILQEASP